MVNPIVPEAAVIAPEDFKADGAFRPVKQKDGSYTCVALHRDIHEGKPRLRRETYGARMGVAGQEPRFGAMHLFSEEDAKAQCKRLNAERGYNGN